LKPISTWTHKALPIFHATPLRWHADIASSRTFSSAFKLGWETSSRSEEAASVITAIGLAAIILIVLGV
jgi:hypothetical protein